MIFNLVLGKNVNIGKLLWFKKFNFIELYDLKQGHYCEIFGYKIELIEKDS